MENKTLTQVPNPSVRTRLGMPARGCDRTFGASWMTSVVICDTQAVDTQGHVAFLDAIVPVPTAWSPPI